MKAKEGSTLWLALFGTEVAIMIIRRIQANEPTEEHTEGEKNNGRVQDSAHCDTNSQSAQIKVVRHEVQNGQENPSIQLRRIYPRSPRL
jgi:hypothetical protein